MKIGFDSEKYMQIQSKHILERIDNFGGKLYLEFGGKLFDDLHASRVLPGFDENAKIKLLQKLKDKCEIIFCISASDIERNKIRADYGITYGAEILRLIDAMTSMKIKVNSIVITKFEDQPSAIAYKNKLEARGIKVYRLNIGQPDVPTPQVAFEAIRNIDRTVLEYSPSEGMYSLRCKLREYYHKFNIDVDVDDIIVTTGGSEAVLFAFMACLDPGDEIIVPEPAYDNYMAFAISAGAKIVTIPSTIDNGFQLPPMQEFEKLINERTKGILICNPNNPTGYLYTMKEMLQLRDLVKRYDLFLFSDEVYREFCYTGAPYISAFHLPGV